MDGLLFAGVPRAVYRTRRRGRRGRARGCQNTGGGCRFATTTRQLHDGECLCSGRRVRGVEQHALIEFHAAAFQTVRNCSPQGLSLRDVPIELGQPATGRTPDSLPLGSRARRLPPRPDQCPRHPCRLRCGDDPHRPHRRRRTQALRKPSTSASALAGPGRANEAHRLRPADASRPVEALIAAPPRRPEANRTTDHVERLTGRHLRAVGHRPRGRVQLMEDLQYGPPGVLPVERVRRVRSPPASPRPSPGDRCPAGSHRRSGSGRRGSISSPR